jgi:hypothetical protein
MNEDEISEVCEQWHCCKELTLRAKVVMAGGKIPTPSIDKHYTMTLKHVLNRL